MEAIAAAELTSTLGESSEPSEIIGEMVDYQQNITRNAEIRRNVHLALSTPEYLAGDCDKELIRNESKLSISV